MAINLHEKYDKQIQTKFTQKSLVNGVLDNSYSFAGVKTVKISTPVTVPMVDYTRTGSNRYGTPTEMQDTVQEMTLTQDKSFSLTIDKGNNADQNGIKEAGKMLSLQIEERAVPLMDKYFLEMLSKKAGKIVGSGTALTKSNVCERITPAHAWNAARKYLIREICNSVRRIGPIASVESTKITARSRLGNINPRLKRYRHNG